MEKFSLFELEPTWVQALGDELHQPYLVPLAVFIERERNGNTPIYPPRELTFNAFYKTPFDKVKVVIIGQDPYHGAGQAHGLSFSVPKGIPPPPSLQNIFKELKADVGIELPSHGCLTKWAEQGVMLLNAILTVRQGGALSHQAKGWEKFTDAVVKALFEKQDSIIFVLWGKSAQEKCRFFKDLNQSRHHLVLTAPHPSPFSAHTGFLGCRHFSKINAHLHSKGQSPINWTL